MKKLLLAITFLSLSAQATTFVPIDYEISPTGKQYFGTTATRGITVLASQVGQISISMVDTNFDVSDSDAIAMSENYLSDVLPWPNGYESGFFANYPELPENPQRFVHLGLTPEMNASEYRLLADAMLIRIKAAIRGLNYLYKDVAGYSSRGVSGDHVLIADHGKSGSGSIYYCNLNEWQFQNDFVSNLSLCANIGSARYIPDAYSVDGNAVFDHIWNGINGYSHPRNLHGSFVLKRERRVGEEGAVLELAFLSPGSNAVVFASDIIGSSNSEIHITDGHEPYLSFKDKYGHSHRYKYSDGELKEASGRVEDFSANYTSIDGDVINYINGEVLYKKEGSIYSCRGFDWKSSSLLFDEYIRYVISYYSGAYGGLLDSYPVKPDNFETLIVDYGDELNNMFWSGMTDAEYRQAIEDELRYGYDYALSESLENIVCLVNTEVRRSDYTFPGFFGFSAVGLGASYEEIKIIGRGDSEFQSSFFAQLFLDDAGNVVGSPYLKMVNSLVASGFGHVVNSAVESLKGLYPEYMANYPDLPEYSDVDWPTPITLPEFHEIVATQIIMRWPYFYDNDVLSSGMFSSPVQAFSSRYISLDADGNSGVLNFHRGKFILGSVGGSSVKVKAVPDRTVVDPYLNPYLNVSIDIEGAAYAGDIQCSVNNSTLTITSSEYGAWGGSNPLRLPLISNANNVRGVVTHTGADEPDSSGTFMQSSLYADMTTATVAVECTAELSAANGQVIPVVIENASITLDDGIHGGEGGVSGVIVLPPGVNAEDVTVSVTINGRTVTLSPNTDGSFTYPGLRDGDYIVSFQADQYVQGCTNATVAGGIISIGSVTLHAGDINGDGEINIADFTFLSGRYGSVTGDELYDARADLNKDGLINVQDLAILAGHFGSTQCVVN